MALDPSPPALVQKGSDTATLIETENVPPSNRSSKQSHQRMDVTDYFEAKSNHETTNDPTVIVKSFPLHNALPNSELQSTTDSAALLSKTQIEKEPMDEKDSTHLSPSLATEAPPLPLSTVEKTLVSPDQLHTPTLSDALSFPLLSTPHRTNEAIVAEDAKDMLFVNSLLPSSSDLPVYRPFGPSLLASDFAASRKRLPLPESYEMLEKFLFALDHVCLFNAARNISSVFHRLVKPIENICHR